MFGIQKSKDPHSEPCEISKMGLFVKIVDSWRPLAIFAFLGVWQGFKHASEVMWFFYFLCFPGVLQTNLHFRYNEISLWDILIIINILAVIMLKILLSSNIEFCCWTKWKLHRIWKKTLCRVFWFCYANINTVIT